MKIILSILFLTSAILVTIFFTMPQFNCTKEKCSYDGIKTLRTNRESYIAAITSSQNLESKRTELEDKYNSVTDDDRQRLENLLPNNVDNIKLLLELEIIAKRNGIIIESPQVAGVVANTNIAPLGQNLRGTNTPTTVSVDSTDLPYGTFDLNFKVRANYENIKNLVSDLEKNLRLIEPISISISVPEVNLADKNMSKLYANGEYDVNIKSLIYYLKN